MSGRPTVVVMMGGPGAEREVSLHSGAEVAAALRSDGRFQVVEQVIDDPRPESVLTLSRTAPAAVFPVLHGAWGEGGPLQAILENAGVPYVGTQPDGAALAMDKHATKERLRSDGMPTPDSVVIDPADACDLAPPLVLKPVDDGSSVDLRICHTPEEVESARRELHGRRPRLLAERYVAGRELTVGIVFGEALPVIEIVPAVEFYDYDAKYERDDTEYVLDPGLPASVAERCRDLALLAFDRLGCRDLARVDFMLDERGPWFLELNTMPGFTTHSLVPMAARAAGREMPVLCGDLVEAALARASVPLVSG